MLLLRMSLVWDQWWNFWS